MSYLLETNVSIITLLMSYFESLFEDLSSCLKKENTSRSPVSETTIKLMFSDFLSDCFFIDIMCGPNGGPKGAKTVCG
ncbi:hypothetical protein L596_020907 [Steinernema carpocapsae]|uniref:Uncharacterized protein n=1 Tax=Steinernema carpocapsae TaxID=34508 RepID=A0A4U5MV47_STECR|nr:hypothetical protein L596_020907 [Steinernema carpocapsae]